MPTALPPGASCGASCQHLKQCRVDLGRKGTENECAHEPSRYTPHKPFMPMVEEQRA